MKKFYTLFVMAIIGAVAAMAQKPVVTIEKVERFDDGEGYMTLVYEVKCPNADKIWSEADVQIGYSSTTYHWQPDTIGTDLYRFTTNKLPVEHPFISSQTSVMWIGVYARNANGETEVEFDVPSEANTGIAELGVDDAVSTIEVFTLQGIQVFKGNADDLGGANLPAGIYVKKATAMSGKVEATKILIP